ncbi:hypothetical protein PR048_008690 [Dryococelus australis]|uniref:DDE Tnp4 domain-containing protein n=1 Tax=Dryococelus australis TaxID=614101 RepID=A0ABQ9HZL5_9NEOP|nr:hypothetical protein PR048_008690 [Dryococelus australis]
MRVIKVSMERCRNEGAGKTGDHRENPPTNFIVRHESLMRKSGVTRTALVGGEHANHSAIGAPSYSGDSKTEETKKKDVCCFFSDCDATEVSEKEKEQPKSGIKPKTFNALGAFTRGHFAALLSGSLAAPQPRVGIVTQSCNAVKRELQQCTAQWMYLGIGCSMSDLSIDYRIGLSTLSGILREVCTAIWVSYKGQCFPPLTVQLILETAPGFGKRANFPHCVAAVDVEKKVFNYHLTRARRYIERCFGILSNKWRLFHRAINVEPDFAETIIKTCYLLHNFVRERDGVRFEDLQKECL